MSTICEKIRYTVSATLKFGKQEDEVLRTEACYISNLGTVRKNNEDSLLLNDLLVSERNMQHGDCLISSASSQVYAVADGMGGHRKGEVASRTVLEVFRDKYEGICDTTGLADVALSAKTTLNWLAAKDRDSFGMGTTVTGLLVTSGKYFLFHCGDSRLYRLVGRSLERLTKDHSLVQRLFDEGVITEEEMRSHPQKNILSAALMGDLQSGLPVVDVQEIDPAAGNTFLLCSDGLWESVGRRDMEECFLPDTNETSCLFDKAMAAGAGDNVSMIVVKILEG
jgi:serine/threonine protein phosphatase PrpC